MRAKFEKFITIVNRNKLKIREAEEGIEKSAKNKTMSINLARKCMRELSEMRQEAIKILEGLFKAKFSISLPQFM